MQTLYVTIGCDVDPDRVGLVDGVPTDKLSWRGMTEGIPRIKKLLRGLTDHRGNEPRFTWLLRVDEQTKEMHGAYDWVLTAHQDFLIGLEKDGDELGWHPHFWRFDRNSGRWYQEIDDIAWQVEMLKLAHQAYVSVLPGRTQSVRMGWAYFNNPTFQTLEELGVKVDFSAIPGLRTLLPKSNNRSENLFDWYPTPRVPYYPSRQDYRRPPAEQEAACTILEVPTFTARSLVWGLASGLQLARKTKNPRQFWQALRHPAYSINITGRPALFAPMAAQLRKDLHQAGKRNLIFATCFHADELLENKRSLYSMESLRANLKTILQVCGRENVAVEFAQARQIPDLISSIGLITDH